MVVADSGLFRCEACGLYYEDRELAERCETYCREHGACNTEIIQNAVEPDD